MFHTASKINTDASNLEKALSKELVFIRRHLHAHPELGMKEHETSLFIRECLTPAGVKIQGPIATTGLFVDIVGEHPGPTVAYRADMDALPIQDLKEATYASRNAGVAHLCGHDAHTTIAIGIALKLQENRDQIHGTVRIFFQPNEESLPSGAPLMIKDGVLDGVEAVYAVHVDPTLPVGKFGLKSGVITASADTFQVEVHGSSTGHSARPHQVVDTIWVTTQIMNSLYQLAGRVHDARNTAVLTLTQLSAGTDALNVIPDTVRFGGSIRVTTLEDRIRLRKKMKAVITQIGTLFDAEVSITFNEGPPPVVNTMREIRVAEKSITTLFGEDAIYHIPAPSMGGEDFAFYLLQRPGALIRLGTSAGPETSYPLHDARFDISEKALILAVRTMSQILLDRLADKS